MALSGEPGPSGPTRRPAVFARELLSVLVGVEFAEVTEDRDGELEAIRVWGTGEFPPAQLVRNITTALSAHLDLRVDAERIHVMSGSPPTRAPVPKEALDAAIAKVLRGDPPAPDGRAGGGAGGGATQDGGEGRAPAPGLGAVPVSDLPAAGVEPTDRIIYEGYEVVSHRSRESLLRVTLEWGDRQFVGQAHGTDDPLQMAEALARATLKALEGIVHTRIRNAGFSLELEGLQFAEAFGYRLVVSVVMLRRDGRTLPLSGSVVVRHGTGLAAILSVLQAADRRVRAILEDDADPRGPRPPSPPPPDAH